MPVTVACLVPAAPVLLPRLAGTRVPELDEVRAAVGEALGRLRGCDLVVVVAPQVDGTLAGLGGPGPSPVQEPPSCLLLGADTPSWPHELAVELLTTVGGVDSARLGWSWGSGPVGGPDPDERFDQLDAMPGRVGLLLLADGSRTRGPRAPGGDDPRGEVVDAELVRALREGRAADVPDADAVGATAGPAVALLARFGGRTDVLHAAAPLGVGYLVGVREVPGPDGRTDDA